MPTFPNKTDRRLHPSSTHSRELRLYLCLLLASDDLAPTSSSEFALGSSHPARTAAAGAGASVEVATCAASAKPTRRSPTRANMPELAQHHPCVWRCAPFSPAPLCSPSHIASGRSARSSHRAYRWQQWRRHALGVLPPGVRSPSATSPTLAVACSPPVGRRRSPPRR